MLFKNKETGLIWEVVHPDHIKRCQNDDNYEPLKNKVVQENESKKGTSKKKKGR